MRTNESDDLPFFALLAGISVLLFLILKPFVMVLSLAAVSAVLLYTPYVRLTRAFGGWRSVAAVCTVGLMLVFLIVPLFLLGWNIFQEAQSVYASMNGNETQSLYLFEQTIENTIRQALPEFTFDAHAYVRSTLAFISNNLGLLVYQTLYIVFEIFLMLLALFFFLRDGHGMLAALVEVSPFGKKVTEDVLHTMYRTIRSVISGTFFNALIRGALVWVAFYLFGIPNAMLWGSIGGIVGAIPGLGTPFAFIPAVAYLFMQGAVLPAVGLALFGVGVVILVDNILTSYFFAKGLSVSPIFVLFSIFGGMLFLGPLGFILGPLALSVFLSVINGRGAA